MHWSNAIPLLCSFPSICHQSLFLTMSAKQGTKGTQGSRHSTWLNKGATLESDNSGMVSGSPTPTWSHHESPANSHSNTAASEDKQLEEDPFMPSTQEVAETLAGMRLSDNCDRGHEVGSIHLMDGVRFHILIILQQVPPVQTQPTKGTPSQTLSSSHLI